LPRSVSSPAFPQTVSLPQGNNVASLAGAGCQTGAKRPGLVTIGASSHSLHC
jgi:hypothetical protein